MKQPQYGGCESLSVKLICNCFVCANQEPTKYGYKVSSLFKQVFIINPIIFSLEQNISRLFRQTFIHYCELHQVWEQPNITAIIYVARTLWPHTLNSEHAQSDLWLPAVGYWLDWFGLDHYCVCAIGLGKSPIWAQGCYKDLCAIYDWGCTYPMFLFSTGLFTLM